MTVICHYIPGMIIFTTKRADPSPGQSTISSLPRGCRNKVSKCNVTIIIATKIFTPREQNCKNYTTNPRYNFIQNESGWVSSRGSGLTRSPVTTVINGQNKGKWVSFRGSGLTTSPFTNGINRGAKRLSRRLFFSFFFTFFHKTPWSFLATWRETFRCVVRSLLWSRWDLLV